MPRLRSQTESPYVQTVPGKTCVCPDHPRWNVLISRLSCDQKYLCVLRAFKRPFVQNFVRTKLPMSRLSSVKSCLYPDYCVFIRVSRPCNFEHPPCTFISVWNYQRSVWELSGVSSQVEVPDGSKYVQSEDEDTGGGRRAFKIFIDWKHRKRTKVWRMRENLNMNAQKYGHELNFALINSKFA